MIFRILLHHIAVTWLATCSFSRYYLEKTFTQAVTFQTFHTQCSLPFLLNPHWNGYSQPLPFFICLSHHHISFHNILFQNFDSSHRRKCVRLCKVHPLSHPFTHTHSMSLTHQHFQTTHSYTYTHTNPHLHSHPQPHPHPHPHREDIAAAASVIPCNNSAHYYKSSHNIL